MKKETTNRYHTLDYILIPFLDFKFLVRDRSAAIVDKLLLSTDHYLVKMTCTLRHNTNSTPNNNNKKPTSSQPSSNNTAPSDISTSKSPPAPQRNFLSTNPAATTTYNHQQIADSIKAYKASNNDSHLTQDVFTPILQSSSSVFPSLQANKKDWFTQDATNLLTLISAKKKSEQKYHQEPTNHSARTKVKQAIKNTKEMWIRKQINKLEKIDVDPFTAWQSSKLLLAALSHPHHVNTKDKYIKLKDNNGKNLTAKPADQVLIQGEFFSQQISSRNSTFNHTAINKLRIIPVNTTIADPITLDELKNALKKANNRKGPGPKGIIIEQYKLLDDENLTFILEIINNYVDDPEYVLNSFSSVLL